MGGKVTAVGMDIVTEKSGHAVAPVAPSVCLTPVGTAVVPIPYPVTGTSTEGIDGATSRTKIGGAKAGTVGSSIKAVHGNEPGTFKEVVSHTTGGPAPLVLGAPIVVMELGMTGITGSPLMANRGPGPSSRTAPGPAMAAASVPAFAVLGGGGDGGDGDDDGNGGKDGAGGDGSGSGEGGHGDQKNACSGQPGQCAKGCPVDVVTGRAYTLPAVDLELPGPLPLVFARMYSSTAASRDVGLGFGWIHSWGWEIEQRRRALVVWSDEGTSTEFPPLEVGAEHVGPWGWSLRRERERLVLDTGNGARKVFAATDEAARRWRLIEIRDRNDNRIELTYDEEGRLCEATDSAGRRIRILSTRAGRIAGLHVYNARARGQWIAVARFTYDEDGNLTAAIDAEGHGARFQYDDEHRLTRETDREGLSFSFVYDRTGRCVETWGEYLGRRDPSLAEDVPAKLADGSKARGILHVRFDFHAAGYSEVADSTQVVRYTGNRHGLVEKEVDGVGVTETTYDARGLVLARMDGEGALTCYERDDRGLIVRVTDPLCRVTHYARDAHGLVTRIVDPAYGVYEIHRDERGNVIHRSDPTGAVWSYTYDARGLMTSATSPVGGVTSFAYDPEGNLVAQTDPNDARWRWEYDMLGRCTVGVDPLGHEVRYAWTERGDLAAVFRGEGSTTRYTYDGERRVTEIQEPGRRTTGLAWGGFHCVVQRTDPTGGVVRSRYNREGELTEVHNELGEVHRLRRDGAGLVVGEETFDGRRLAYRRDHVGRVVRVEAAGEITEYAYNAAGALVARTLSDDAVETFEHDALGSVVRVAWPGGELRFERDEVGRVKREVQVLQGEEHTVASFYDPAGERVRRFTSCGHVEHVERDVMGERTRTVLDEVHDVQHARDPLGREAMVALPRGGRIQHDYDPLGRVRRRWATSPGTMQPVRFEDPQWVGGAAPGQPARVTAEREFRYDEAGELSDTLDRRRGWVQYEYDPAGRLLSVLREATGEAERFRYDAAGSPYEADGGEVEARVYGPGGRLLRRGAMVYTWDEVGRLAEKHCGADVWRYSWDAAGRLAAVDLPDGRRAEYAYDPFDRRLEARIFAARELGEETREAERTRFVWDGNTLAHEIRMRAAEGDPVVEERTFCFEDGSFVPWAQCDDTPDGFGGRRHAWAFFVNDPIGTPDELVGEDGSVAAEMDRRAWGRTEGGGQGTPVRFQGQYEDAETELFYNRFRYYDPEAGLYISPDPIGLRGGIRSLAYVRNPNGWVDPLGLVEIDRAGSVTVDAYAGPPAGGIEHSPLHAHFREGKGRDAVETRILMEDYYKKGQRVGCKGEPYSDDPAPTKNMRKILRDPARVETLATKTRNVFNTGKE
jgi:RHS repeat-associated protein